MLKGVGLDDGWGYCFNGTKYCNGQPSSAGEKLTTTNDVIMIAFDADLKRLWFGKNGKWFRGTPSDSSKSDFEDVQVPVYPAVSLKKEDGQNIEIIVKSSKLSCEHPIPNGFSTFY